MTDRASPDKSLHSRGRMKWRRAAVLAPTPTEQTKESPSRFLPTLLTWPNRMTHLNKTVFLAMCLSAPACAAQEPSSGPETIPEFLLKYQDAVLSRYVARCAREVPDLAASLNSAYGKFRIQFQEASAAYAAQVGGINKPVSQELMAPLRAAVNGLYPLVQMDVPKEHCSIFLANLANATTESIRAGFENSVARHGAQDATKR